MCVSFLNPWEIYEKCLKICDDDDDSYSLLRCLLLVIICCVTAMKDDLSSNRDRDKMNSIFFPFYTLQAGFLICCSSPLKTFIHVRDFSLISKKSAYLHETRSAFWTADMTWHSMTLREYINVSRQIQVGKVGSRYLWRSGCLLDPLAGHSDTGY